MLSNVIQLAGSALSRRRPWLAGLLLVLLSACSSTVPPLSSDHIWRSPQVRIETESLRTSVQSLVDGGGNHGRRQAILGRIKSMELISEVRTEPIDWFSWQKNLLIEIPGASSRVIYIVAHYDKTDHNPVKFLSLLLNGLFDEAVGLTFFSDGALDNATGVAVALELARAFEAKPPPYTLRIFFPGAEESGLRGSRAHVARLSEDEREAIALVINVDTVGVAGHRNCTSLGLDDGGYLLQAVAAARRLDLDLGQEQVASLVVSDYAPFMNAGFGSDFRLGLQTNLLGGLLPQRSWFSSSFSAPVLNFNACDLNESGTELDPTSLLLPLGALHGPRDQARLVDPEKIWEVFAIIEELISHSPEHHP